HTQLTARRALQYSAELRFPPDTTAAERNARVTEVMEELGLSKHAETRADRLSGGQLKRMNVAQELLTRPSLLFLDEPTSGLDPGLDKSVMLQLRVLAHLRPLRGGAAAADSGAARRAATDAGPARAAAPGTAAVRHADPAVRAGDRRGPGLRAVHGATPARARAADQVRARDAGTRRAERQHVRPGTAADPRHLRVPRRHRVFRPRAGQGTPDLHQGTGGRPVARRLPAVQADP